MTYNVGLILLTIGFLITIYGFRTSSKNQIAERLQVYLRDDQPTVMAPIVPRQYRRATIVGTFRNRILIPVFQKSSMILGRLTPGRLSKEMENQLAVAGNPLGMGPREFYGIRIFFVIIGVAISFYMIRANLAPTANRDSLLAIPVTGTSTIGIVPEERSISLSGVLISILALVVVSNLPKTWLRAKARARINDIRRTLPDALDMLSVCAEAGLGFDQSLQRVSDSWDNTLSRELGRVVAEMGMGLSRRVALRNLTDRTRVPELGSFVAVIIQSDQLGMSIKQTLHAQAKQMRIERRFRAQEQARKMPMKMLVPLILLIFPAMFAVILGPMVPVIGDLFATLGQ